MATLQHKRLREPRRSAGRPALFALKPHRCHQNGADLGGGEIRAGGDVSFLSHTQMLRQWMACQQQLLLKKREKRGKTALCVTGKKINKKQRSLFFVVFFFVLRSLLDNKVRGSKRHRGTAQPLILDDGPVTRTRAPQQNRRLLIISTDR